MAVRKDTSEWDTFAKEITESAGSPILVSGSGDTIVLSGPVKSAEESKRLAGMAQTRAKTVINLLQAPPAAELRQILLQVKFAAVDRVALSQIGFNLFSTNDKVMGSLTTQQFSPPRFSQLQVQGGQVTGNTVNFSDLLNLFAFRPDINLGATIKALQERNLLQILAEPNLITTEGKDASFLAGGSFPFPTITTTPTGGATAPVITVQFKPFGVKLDFTPTVTAQGAISLKVAPEVSSLDFSNAVTLAGFHHPGALAAARRDRGDSEGRRKLRDRRTDRQPRDRNHEPRARHRRPAGSRQAVPQPEHPEIDRRTAGRDLAAFCAAAGARRSRPQLPEMPASFLPASSEPVKGKGKGKAPAKVPANQPEFVGPRGQQIPK